MPEQRKQGGDDVVRVDAARRGDRVPDFGCRDGDNRQADSLDEGTAERSAAQTWARVEARRRTVCVYCGKRIPGALTKAERRHKHRFSPEQILSARFTCMKHRNLPLDDPHYESLFGGRRG